MASVAHLRLQLLRRLQENVDNGEVKEEDTITQLILVCGLFLLMVGVGASCKIPLVKKILRSPKALQATAVGVACQFVFMPIVAYLLTLVFQVKGYTALGFVLAGCMPGGGSSNVFAIWAQGILELSVFMTIVSTVLAFGMTPLWLYAFSHIIDDIDDTALGFTEIAITFALLVIPLAIGVATNFVPCTKRLRHYIETFVNVLAIVVFSAAVVALAVQYPEALRDYATWELYVAATIYFPIATGLSYGLTYLLKFAPALRRTVVIEVGLQNLALAFAIGSQTLDTRNQQYETLPFPLLYAMLQYFWCAMMIPVSRWQKQRNNRLGIKDNDSDFFLEGNDDDMHDDSQKDMHLEDTNLVRDDSSNDKGSNHEKDESLPVSPVGGTGEGDNDDPVASAV